MQHPIGRPKGEAATVVNVRIPKVCQQTPSRSHRRWRQ
jgi:hypothetical protein